MRSKIVARALAIVGMSRDQLGMSGTYAWCAHTVSKVLEYVGIDMYDLSCSNMYKKMVASSEWDEPETNPIPGDIILFDWDHIVEERPLDHVGIIVDFNSSTGVITYVNGNGSSSKYVTKQTINIKNSTVAHWMRYVGKNATSAASSKDSTSTPVVTVAKKPTYCKVELEELSKGCESASVETAQNLLVDVGFNIKVDGKFGDETAKAVTEFQRISHINQDAIIGPNTWKALIEAI